MSNLNNALERILNWFQKNQPELAQSFLPGISRNLINQIEKEMGFKVSEEIYQLYQWRNGSELEIDTLCFPSMQFLPIDTALVISNAVSINSFFSEDEEGYTYQEKPVFTFILDHDYGFCIPLDIIRHEQSPVYYFFGEEPELIQYYDSITAMMLTLAEYYETGAYYLNEQNLMCENQRKCAQILLKYNFKTNNQALNKLQFLLNQKLDFSSDELLGEFMDILGVIVRFNDSKGVNLLIDALISWQYAKGYVRDELIGRILVALSNIYDLKTIIYIENALSDKSSYVRKKAKEALARLNSLQ